MKRKLNLQWMLILGVVFLLLSGCAGGLTAEPTPERATDLPPTEPAQTDQAPETGEDGMSEQALIDLAKEDLASRLDIEKEAISVVSTEAKEWSDASLGCPEEGEMYAQVITPGYQILLETEGAEYDYRTDLSGNLKLCEQ